MANILVNSKSLTLADLYDIDEVIAGAKDFAELSELARCYMQNIARALPAYADISGYADQEFNPDTDIMDGLRRNPDMATVVAWDEGEPVYASSID
jgi:hypothetical protein